MTNPTEAVELTREAVERCLKSWETGSPQIRSIIPALARFWLAAQSRQDEARDAARRLDWFIQWYLRDGKRSEIDPAGHIRFTTKEIILAAIDAAISKEPSQ